MKQPIQPGEDLFGYDPAAAAAEFAAVHQGGLTPMPLGGGYDGTPRNAAARAETLAETGQANDYMAECMIPTDDEVSGMVEAPSSTTEEAVVLSAAERARRLLATEYGLAPTPPARRKLATHDIHFDAYAGPR